MTTMREKTKIIETFSLRKSHKKHKLFIHLNNTIIPLTYFPFHIGSHKSNDLALEDEFVSKQHCRITKNGTFYFIEDLTSTNGSFLNKQKIEKAKLLKSNVIEIGKTRLKVEIQTVTHKKILEKNEAFHGIVTRSPTMHEIFELIQNFAVLPDPVLIQGETGSGKELVAHALHQESSLKGSFIALNCGAISYELIESELFGHTQGAFTDAREDRKGAFELAHGGTLFLDEIAELPLSQQVKLLRVLETGEITPVGSEEKRKVHIRIIAATHQNLKTRVEEKTFREDLYYRLHVLPLILPPLRKRREDIALLSQHFASLKGKEMSRLLIPLLESHAWEGNIRELKNTIFHLSALSSNTLIGLSEWKTLKGTSLTEEHKIKNIEKKEIKSLLQKFQGNRTKVAEELGLSRSTLYRKLLSYDININE
ncbi:MAG: sigma 54-interacting transcriptional regulator [Deltaproteobacteria bacterium]|nr:sigma 54-interacting transcriptional regulator [Deltaproteobacteria bacterium]